jgi:hypothetical protein
MARGAYSEARCRPTEVSVKQEKVEAQRRQPLSPKEEQCTDVDSEPNLEAQDPDDFDWLRDPAVILHDQAAVAAYFNPINELVVKQRDTLGYEATIFIAPENVEKFLDGLTLRARPAPRKKLRLVDGGGE